MQGALHYTLSQLEDDGGSLDVDARQLLDDMQHRWQRERYANSAQIMYWLPSCIWNGACEPNCSLLLAHYYR